jgi:hypothetical protein
MVDKTATKKMSATLKMALLLFALAVFSALVQGGQTVAGLLFFAAVVCAIVGGIRARSRS